MESKLKNKIIDEFDAKFGIDFLVVNQGVPPYPGLQYRESDVRDFINYALDRQKEEIEKIPYNVSEWKKIGIERGYWYYFEKEIKKEILSNLPKIEKRVGAGASYQLGFNKCLKAVKSIIKSI
jgi:hypothetical protein